jgi:hypothetical protein
MQLSKHGTFAKSNHIKGDSSLKNNIIFQISFPFNVERNHGSNICNFLIRLNNNLKTLPTSGYHFIDTYAYIARI